MKPYSIIDYLKEYYYSDLMQYVANFLSGVEENQPQSVIIKHLNIKSISVYNYTDSEITIELSVEILVFLNGVCRKKQMVIQLSGALNNLIVTDIQEGARSAEFRKNSLSTSLVPYIRREQYDEIAEELLREYYPEALQSPMRVDAFRLAGRMKLCICKHTITQDHSVFGRIYFDSCKASFYEGQELKEERVKPGTIFADPAVYYLRNVGCLDNTVVHECVHWKLHRKAMMLASYCSKQESVISCSVNELTNEKNPFYWMEKQANAIAPKIQMPREMFKRKAEELIAQKMEQEKTNEFVDVMNSVIDALANFFGVSRVSAKIRMYEIGYEQVLGAYNYANGNYIMPYGFRQHALQWNQTYTIGIEDLLYAVKLFPELREKLISGEYIYIDAHLCRNDRKYRKRHFFSRKVEMKSYARYHMDEACIPFTILQREQENPENISLVYFLNQKNHSSSVTTNCDVQLSMKDRAILAESMLQDIKKLQPLMQNDLSSTIKKLLKERGMSQEQLAGICHINTRNLSRYLKGNKFKREVVISICLGLNLPPAISMQLLALGGYCLCPTRPDDQRYQVILHTYYGLNKEEICGFGLNSLITEIMRK